MTRLDSVLGSISLAFNRELDMGRVTFVTANLKEVPSSTAFRESFQHDAHTARPGAPAATFDRAVTADRYGQH
jgi:hypothetical protein